MKKIFLLLSSILASLLLTEFFFFGAASGLGYTILFVGFAALSYLLLGTPKGGKRHKVEHFFLLAVIVLLAVPFFLFDNWTIKMLLFFVLLGLIPAFYLHNSASDKLTWKSFLFLGELFVGFFARPFACIGSSMKIVFRKKSAPAQEAVPQEMPQGTAPSETMQQRPGAFNVYNGSMPPQMAKPSHTKKPILMQVIIGLVIACPLLLFLLVILASADPLFADFVTQSIAFIRNIQITKYFFHVLFAVLILPFLLSWMWSFKKPMVFFAYEAEALKAGKKRTTMPDVVAITVLSSVNLLYLAYAAVQFVYVVGVAWAGTLPGGIEPAVYARTGFFELSFLAVLNLIMLVVSARFTGRDGVSGRVISFLSVLMTMLSLIQLVSAAIRMFVYVETFGLSRMRLFVLAFLFLLGALFLLLILREFIRKLSAFVPITVITLVFLVVFSFMSPDRVIAEFNIAQAEAGYTEELDLDYLLYELSDDSRIVLFRNLERLEALDTDFAVQLKTYARREWSPEWGWNFESLKGLNVSHLRLQQIIGEKYDFSV